MIVTLLTDLFENNIYVFLFIIPFLAQLGIPLGAMFFILYAGSVATGIIELNNFFFIVLIATIIGDILSYFIARKFAENILFKKILAKKKISSLNYRAKLFFDKYGQVSIFITRFIITGLGPYLNYVIGLQKYKFRKFIVFVILGEILYALELLLVGYIFKDTFEDIMNMFLDFSYLILILIGLYYVGKKIYNFEKSKS